MVLTLYSPITGRQIIFNPMKEDTIHTMQDTGAGIAL